MLRAGYGYKYWHDFELHIRRQIEQQAKDIYEQLWTPILEVPIRTPNLPIAGSNYSTYTLSLLYQFISLANQVEGNAKIRKPRKVVADLKADDPEADRDGIRTLEHLRNVRWIADRISSKDYAGSLGLHPAVYFYSAEGRFQQTSFLAIVRMVQQFQRDKSFIRFTTLRGSFEDFLIKYKHFSNQVTAKWGSGIKAYERYYDLLLFILEQLESSHATTQRLLPDVEEGIVSAIQKHEIFKFLNVYEPPILEEEVGRDFSKPVRSRIFIEQAIFRAAVYCPLCLGHIDTYKSHSTDHTLRKDDGGRGYPENAQLTHLFCNTGYKEWLESQKAKEPS
jgi:hypothetical protein